jgi:hypothetical protein
MLLLDDPRWSELAGKPGSLGACSARSLAGSLRRFAQKRRASSARRVVKKEVADAAAREGSTDSNIPTYSIEETDFKKLGADWEKP